MPVVFHRERSISSLTISHCLSVEEIKDDMVLLGGLGPLTPSNKCYLNMHQGARVPFEGRISKTALGL